MPTKSKNSLDMGLMESIIAYNAIMDEVYMASIIDSIQPEYFENKHIKTVFTVARDFFNKHGEIPTSTEIKTHLSSSDEKESFKRVLENFKILDSKYNQIELYENTENFLRERAVYCAVKKTIEDYSNDKEKIDPAKTLELFEDACSISLVDDMGLDLFSNIDENLGRLEKTYRYISTGYPWLDKVMGGGLMRDGRSLYVFSGVTNSGKSIILGNLAVNLVRQNNPVIIISMEMSEDVYLKRIVSQMTGIPMKVLKNEIAPVKEIAIEHISNNPNGKLYIKEFAPKSVTPNHLRAYIKKLCNKKRIKPAAIIIDYVNLIQPNVVTGQSYSDVKAVTENLRGLSYIFECPVITATQLNRKAFEKNDPGMETISESLGLAMTADFQAAISSNEADKELGIIHMSIQKNRFGLNYGKEAFRINYDTLTIETMEEDFTSSDHVGDAEDSLQDILGNL